MWIVIPFVMLVSQAAAAGPVPSASPVWVDANPTALTVSIAADRGAYTCDADVSVRISITNTSAKPVLFFTSASFADFNLRVSANGASVTPDSSPVRWAVNLPGRPSVLKPGQTWVERGSQNGYLTNTMAWGFSLRKPSAYTLVAVKQFSNNRELTSNSIVIKRPSCDRST